MFDTVCEVSQVEGICSREGSASLLMQVIAGFAEVDQHESYVLLGIYEKNLLHDSWEGLPIILVITWKKPFMMLFQGS
jgi:hypothetical protein